MKHPNYRVAFFLRFGRWPEPVSGRRLLSFAMAVGALGRVR